MKKILLTFLVMPFYFLGVLALVLIHAFLFVWLFVCSKLFVRDEAAESHEVKI